MLIAMADESGYQTDGYFAMAGYVAADWEWHALQRRWDAALKRHNAPYLHMKELAGSRGVYQGWSEDQRRGLLGDLLDIISQTSLNGFGAVIKVSDFAALSASNRQALIGPYVVCWQELMMGLGIYDLEVFPGDRLHFVYSRQDEFRTRMRSLWDFVKAQGQYHGKLGVLEFQDMRLVAGLQAADLLVYELRHLFHLRDSRPDLGWRVPYKRLISHQHDLGSHRMRYLSPWILRSQADGTYEVMRDLVFDRPELFGFMYDQTRVPGVNPDAGTQVMRVLERYIPWDGLIGRVDVFRDPQYRATALRLKRDLAPSGMKGTSSC